MDWVVTIITALITGGLGATIGTIYTARKNSEVGMSGNEVEAVKATTADWAAFTDYMNGVVSRQDAKINGLETTIGEKIAQAFHDSIYIDDLQNHINLGLGPPVPSRRSK